MCSCVYVYVCVYMENFLCPGQMWMPEDADKMEDVSCVLAQSIKIKRTIV